MRALYVSPMVYGANQAVDAISHGLEAELDAHGIEMRVAYADFDDTGLEGAGRPGGAGRGGRGLRRDRGVGHRPGRAR